MSETGYCDIDGVNDATAVISSQVNTSPGTVDSNFMYNYDFINSTTTITYSNYYIELSNLISTNIDTNGNKNTLIQYNKINYTNLDLIRIYIPSLHYYTNVPSSESITDASTQLMSASAEMIFQHSDDKQSPLCFLCIPITISDDTNASSYTNNFMGGILASLSSSSSMDITEYPINKLISNNVPLYFYSGKNVLTSLSNMNCNSDSNIICYHLNDKTNNITTDNYKNLSKYITNNTRTSNNKSSVSSSILRLPNGAIPYTINKEQDIFIDCVPVNYDGSDIEQITIVNKSPEMSSSNTDNKSIHFMGTFIDPIQLLNIFLGIIIIIVVLGVFIFNK